MGRLSGLWRMKRLGREAGLLPFGVWGQLWVSEEAGRLRSPEETHSELSRVCVTWGLPVVPWACTNENLSHGTSKVGGSTPVTLSPILPAPHPSPFMQSFLPAEFPVNCTICWFSLCLDKIPSKSGWSRKGLFQLTVWRYITAGKTRQYELEAACHTESVFRKQWEMNAGPQPTSFSSHSLGCQSIAWDFPR